VCVCMYVCVCMCVALYTVFSYALLSYVHIISYKFLHMNQQDVPVCCVVCDVCVCPNYYLFPIALPTPPDAVLLGIISIDVILQQWG